MLDRDPKRRRLTPLNAPFRSPLRTSAPSSTPSTPTIPAHPKNSPLAQYTTPKRKLPPRTFKSPVLGRNADEDLSPEVISLIHRKRALEKTIHEEKKALETAELALQYEKQDQDDQMELLIRKWRRCAQKTCERVFITVKARVIRMGGLGKFASNHARQTWDDEQQNTDSQDVNVPSPKEEEEVDDEFTMEIMLKMLGVDEEIIKWDRGLCNFIKD